MRIDTTVFLVLASVVARAELKRCGPIIESNVTTEEKELIVNKHNEFRRLAARGEIPNQPKAINMKKLYWDDSLAQSAQDIANSCKFEHIPKVKDKRWHRIGQNTLVSRIWSLTGQIVNGSDWLAAIQTWYNEHKEYHYPEEIDSKHYSQLIWADTRYIGCGYTSYKMSKHYNNKVYICSYGPGGNIPGHAPYKTGNKGCENLC